jgi:hypothetical protein
VKRQLCAAGLVTLCLVGCSRSMRAAAGASVSDAAASDVRDAMPDDAAADATDASSPGSPDAASAKSCDAGSSLQENAAPRNAGEDANTAGSAAHGCGSVCPVPVRSVWHRAGAGGPGFEHVALDPKRKRAVVISGGALLTIDLQTASEEASDPVLRSGSAGARSRSTLRPIESWRRARTSA